MDHILESYQFWKFWFFKGVRENTVDRKNTKEIKFVSLRETLLPLLLAIVSVGILWYYFDSLRDIVHLGPNVLVFILAVVMHLLGSWCRAQYLAYPESRLPLQVLFVLGVYVWLMENILLVFWVLNLLFHFVKAS